LSSGPPSVTPPPLHALENPDAPAVKREEEEDWGGDGSHAPIDASVLRSTRTDRITPSTAASGRWAVSMRSAEAAKTDAGFGHSTAFSALGPPLSGRMRGSAALSGQLVTPGNGTAGCLSISRVPRYPTGDEPAPGDRNAKELIGSKAAAFCAVPPLMRARKVGFVWQESRPTKAPMLRGQCRRRALLRNLSW
jgi:hypothetical protein